MTLSEKAAYLKGLMEGLDLKQDAPEGKMISGIVDLLQEMATSIADLKENALAISDELDEIEDEMDEIESFLMDDDYEDDDFDFDEDDDYEDDDYEDDAIYDVTCPSCGKVLHLDEETILQESIHCPNCNELLEFDFDEDDEKDEPLEF